MIESCYLSEVVTEEGVVAFKVDKERKKTA